MATMLNIYLTKEKIDIIKQTLDKKGEKGISLTVSINDTANDFGQNVSAFVTQSKEEREVKKPKFYVGNGSVFWNEGVPLVVTKQSKNEAKTSPAPVPVAEGEKDDLPF